MEIPAYFASISGERSLYKEKKAVTFVDSKEKSSNAGIGKCAKRKKFFCVFWKFLIIGKHAIFGGFGVLKVYQ